MKNLIDRDEILDILDERFGFWDFVRDLIDKYDLNEHEDKLLLFSEDILEGILNVIRTTENIEV
jgi:hypothetical protein